MECQKSATCGFYEKSCEKEPCLPKKITVPRSILYEVERRMDIFLDAFDALEDITGGFSISELFDKVGKENETTIFHERGYQDALEFCEIDVEMLSKIKLKDYKKD